LSSRCILKRWIVFPNGKDKAKMPFLDKDDLQRKGAIVITKKGPSIVSKNNIEYLSPLTNMYLLFSLPKLLITDQIPRNTSFENGFPLQYKESHYSSKLTSDSLVKDDQAIVANVKGKGLVIISACAHSAIINTINYAKFLTGIDKIFAVLGGFHLTGGKMYDDAFEPTIKELEKANPKYIVPCHCTGWKATNRIIQEMPEQFLQSSVCSEFTFESKQHML
jgi:7,8-dihydropterin-6-yl-methyl-4-(beta-D-ribofuranosyl)aminobenzene 5'-phosphate synthase